MNKLLLRSLAIIFGGLALSVELYGLKIIQVLEMQKGSWQTHSISYATETPITLALWITVAVIAYGIVLVVMSKKEEKQFYR